MDMDINFHTHSNNVLLTWYIKTMNMNRVDSIVMCSEWVRQYRKACQGSSNWVSRRCNVDVLCRQIDVSSSRMVAHAR